MISGEWDCSDASDEQAIFIIKEFSAHNRLLAVDFTKVLQTCWNRYRQQPFNNICNLTEQYPCLPANISSSIPLLDQITSTHRPCISLNQIGDGISNCYGAIDERNLISDCTTSSEQIGFNFRCKTNNSLMNCQIEYPYLCNAIMRCSNKQDDAVLCSYRPNISHSECNENNALDVVCYDGECKKNARCNGELQCTYGEDEYWCNTAKNTGDGNFFYRQSRRKGRTDRQYLVSLPDYPNMHDDEKQRVRTISSERIIDKQLLPFEIYQTNAMIPSICNRGIAVQYFDQIVCFCPPSLYGRFCQYYSDRITVITHIKRHVTNFMYLNVLATLIFQNETMIDYHLFRTATNSEQKQRFYLLYKRSKMFLSYKQQRYMNREQITKEHPFSIRFEAYDDNMTLIFVWYYHIYFDFLPAFRFSKVLKINQTNSTLACPTDHRCNRLHSTCYRYQNLFNKDLYYCHCKENFMGPYCNEFDQHQYCKQCSEKSVCKPAYPLCLCSPNIYGSGCHQSIDSMCSENNPCQNNGTCYYSFDPSSEEHYRCECSDQFQGKYCEIEKMRLKIYLENMQLRDVVATVQYYNLNRRTLQLDLESQYWYDGQYLLFSPIKLDYSLKRPPTLGILKMYLDAETRTHPIYYLLYIQINIILVSITVNLTESNQCLGKKRRDDVLFLTPLS